jgi:KUP system potassium uptake protein
LELAAPSLHAFVIPITILILIGLFAMQRRGTAGIGAIFGPITLTWFVVLAALGIYRIVAHPEVLLAVNPLYAVQFFMLHGWAGIIVLGSVMLVVTGGESLYADLGHFGRRPIRLAWISVVFPALFLNYMGQGALLVAQPETAENPFFKMAPGWATLPLVLLSTMATTIASQALISGVYSLTSQATMLGLLPRVSVRHTSAMERGQIYVPTVNWALMLACIGLVLGFRNSSSLAAAYGVAVILTMVITTILLFFLVHYAWGWSFPKAGLLLAAFLIPELFFVSSNVPKIVHGGWFPLVVAFGLLVFMTTWKRGREVLFRRFQEQLLPLQDFFELMHVELPARVPGTAVFMTSSHNGTPPALLHNFMHNRVVHQHVVLVTMRTEESARVSPSERFSMEKLENGFIRVIGRYGFMEQPDVPELLMKGGVIRSCEHTSFFLGRENLVTSGKPALPRWRVSLFAFMSRNAQPATKFFNIPPDRVVEMGAQIAL